MTVRSRQQALLLAIALGVSLPGLGSARADVSARVETGLLSTALPATGVIARFDRFVPEGITTLAGFTLQHRFVSVPAVYGTASPAGIHALAALPGLAYLERDKELALDLDTAKAASRAAEVWAPGSPLSDPQGRSVDGRGVGIAIVDYGLDGLHPDYEVPGKVGGNYLVSPGAPDGVVASPYTVGAHPHGTHVAGIAAGSGALDNRLKGVAPGATLYAFGMGAATVVHPAIAFDWILQHGSTQSPPIRVLNNSWHCVKSAVCSQFNPNQIHVHLASQLAASGVTITWSAGNDAGDGFTPTTNIESLNPTPGILSVANYDDEDRGTRARCVVNSSSRGAAAVPETWPEVAAPGTNIMSTWALGPSSDAALATANTRLPDGRNAYRQLSGTSMAAPHVAGIVALMLQARPDLTPGQVEYLLKGTAEKLDCAIQTGGPALAYVSADPAHTYDGSNYRDGHGLVDAVAAVSAAMSFTSIPPLPAAEALPDDFLSIRIGVSTDRTFYLRGEDALSEQRPQTPAAPRALQGGATVAYTSDPFDATYSASGVEVGAWIGTASEFCTTYLVPGALDVSVQHVAAEGGTTVIAFRETSLRFTCPAVPIYRKWVFPLEESITFHPGDRLRVGIRVRSGIPQDLAESAWLLYADSEPTPSHVILGQRIKPVLPGTDAACQVRTDCMLIGGERRFASIWCGGPITAEPVFTVIWTGPAGSMAGINCQGMAASCVVPGVPGVDPWGTCTAQTQGRAAYRSYHTVCFYQTPDGAREGYGRCEGTPPITGGD